MGETFWAPWQAVRPKADWGGGHFSCPAAVCIHTSKPSQWVTPQSPYVTTRYTIHPVNLAHLPGTLKKGVGDDLFEFAGCSYLVRRHLDAPKFRAVPSRDAILKKHRNINHMSNKLVFHVLPYTRNAKWLPLETWEPPYGNTNSPLLSRAPTPMSPQQVPAPFRSLKPPCSLAGQVSRLCRIFPLLTGWCL